MKIFPIRRRTRLRKCKHCNEFYAPDPRNLWHQQYCSKKECRQASKRAAQRRWLSSCKGEGYFTGTENVARVREWRAAHPGYWKRAVSKGKNAFQDVSPSDLPAGQTVTESLPATALQDICSLQPALIIGLIASLTGSSLQDEIAQTTRRYIDSGRDILGCSPKPLRH